MTTRRRGQRRAVPAVPAASQPPPIVRATLSLLLTQIGRYWNMTRTEYTHLIGLAERNTKE